VSWGGDLLCGTWGTHGCDLSDFVARSPLSPAEGKTEQTEGSGGSRNLHHLPPPPARASTCGPACGEGRCQSWQGRGKVVDSHHHHPRNWNLSCLPPGSVPAFPLTTSCQHTCPPGSWSVWAREGQGRGGFGLTPPPVPRPVGAVYAGAGRVRGRGWLVIIKCSSASAPLSTHCLVRASASLSTHHLCPPVSLLWRNGEGVGGKPVERL
jgi:hypothetical protein